MANDKAPNKRSSLEEILQEERTYTDADIEKMIEAARSPTDDPGWRARVASQHNNLTSRVELAAATFAHEKLWQAHPAPSSVVKDMDKIARAGRRLLVAMNVPKDATNPSVALTDNARAALQAQLAALAEQDQGYPGAFPDLRPSEWPSPDQADQANYIDYHPGQALRRATAAVYLLTRAAQAAMTQMKGKVRPGPWKKNQGKVALRTLIHSLEDIYGSIFEHAPGSSVSADGRVGGPEIRFIQAALHPLDIETTNDAIREYLRRR